MLRLSILKVRLTSMRIVRDERAQTHFPGCKSYINNFVNSQKYNVLNDLMFRNPRGYSYTVELGRLGYVSPHAVSVSFSWKRNTNMI